MRIVIPVKPLADAKSRLGSVLSPSQRVQVVCDLLDRALQAALATAPVSVVTADPAVTMRARAAGADVIEEARASGLNAAVGLAAHLLYVTNEDVMFVLVADLPEITAEALAEMAARWRPGTMVIAPSSDGGTNALLLAPGAAFAFAYGPDSFARHCANATEAGLTVVVHDRRVLRLDLDRPQDLAQWEGQPDRSADYAAIFQD